MRSCIVRRPLSSSSSSVRRLLPGPRFVMEKATRLILGVKGPWLTPTWVTQNKVTATYFLDFMGQSSLFTCIPMGKVFGSYSNASAEIRVAIYSSPMSKIELCSVSQNVAFSDSLICPTPRPKRILSIRI